MADVVLVVASARVLAEPNCAPTEEQATNIIATEAIDAKDRMGRAGLDSFPRLRVIPRG